MNVVLAMPAFMPSPALVELIRKLSATMDTPVVVVDDGSGEAFRDIFDKVAAMSGCTVLRHATNRGKGAALKTAFTFIAENFPGYAGIVTVDSDGQHAPEDCLRLADAMRRGPRAFFLGVRSLAFRTTPFRSWWGNRWTSLLFALLFRRWIPDTQTGLRAFRGADIPFFLSVPGDGYEYEMAALARAVGAGMAVRTISAETIYDTDGSSSHFKPLRDTVRIYRVLLSAFFAMKKKTLVIGIALAAIAIAILVGMLRHADDTGDTVETPSQAVRPGSSDVSSDNQSRSRRRGQPDQATTVAKRQEAPKPTTSDEDAPPADDAERNEREEESLVDAFDALTDKWIPPAPKDRGITMEEVKQFSTQFRKVPKKRRAECLQRALNLVPDENVMLLAGILMDKTLDKETLDAVYNDVLNRSEDVKKPILQQIFKDREHPCWADTAWILDVTGQLPKSK